MRRVSSSNLYDEKQKNPSSLIATGVQFLGAGNGIRKLPIETAQNPNT
jgi:hypothetical protein